MALSSTKIPAHEVVYQKIRDKILFGDLAPGQAVTINGLVDEIGVSMTPVREAIRRLTAEGALEFLGNRRVTVPQMGPDRFDELVHARLAIEPKLAVLAARLIVADGIETLKTIDQHLDNAITAGNAVGYMRQNHSFHFTLYSHAQSQILHPIAETLWLRYGPLSRIICGKYGTSNLKDRHEEAIAALLRGDPQKVGAAIYKDIEQGFKIVRDNYDWPKI